VLNAERLTPEDIEKDTPATKIEKEKHKAPKTTTVKAEEEQPSTQTEEAVAAKQVEQTAEIQQTQEENIEGSQVPEANIAADDSTEKQPEQDQIETPEETDKQE
ncbi:MAG: hypothetical protein PVJ60_08315, partial [Phycisphaerales bacterium]